MHDLRHACRSLSKSRGYATVAILIVALGVGAATAIFSAVNGVILRPFALPDPDRLVAVYETNLSRNLTIFSVSAPNYADWRDRSRSWQSLAALDWRTMNLTGHGEPEIIAVRGVTANFLPTFGIAPSLGRNFFDEEDRPNAHRVAIVSDAFWRRHFAASPDVIGCTLLFDNTPYTVVGVTSAAAPLPGNLEVMVPMAADFAREDRLNHEIEVYGRLKPGVTFEQADAEMKATAAQIWADNPQFERGWSARLLPFAHEVVGDNVRNALYVLFGAVAVLLLIACANLSNLMLVRAAARSHELAVRTALGASRWRIIRQLIGEAIVVTVIGGAVGVLLALWAVDALRALPLPRAAEISIDLRVLTLAAGATLLTTLLSSIGPALRASQAQPQDALKSRSSRVTHRSRSRDAMVVAQIALSLTLLIGAALLARSFVKLLHVNPGFTTENVLTVAMRPSSKEARAIAFYDDVIARVATLPGVSAVGTISTLPLTDANTSLNVFPTGTSALPPGESVQAEWRLVDGDYFGAMRIPLLRGKTFAGLPADEARRSMVISTSLARALFGDADPLGREIQPGSGDNKLKVIGVVGDVRSHHLGSAPAPTFYWSLQRFTYGRQKLVVRSSGEVAPLVAAIRQTVKSIDPTVPLSWIRTLAELRADSLQQERLLLGLLGGFAGIALLLAALGTYGVIAFMVEQRTHEIGIRLSIGAQAGDVLRLILGEGARLVLLGGTVGLLGSFVAARVLASTLYQTSSHDAISYAIATLTLAAAAFIAALLPARRATRVDPITALRAE